MENEGKLLFEDLKHFGDLLWRNEEAGEKRFNFFVTLITAVAAGLTTLHTAKDLGPNIDRRFVTICAISGLLFFGSITFLRMLQRIKVRKEFHATLGYIRGELTTLGQAPKTYRVPRKEPDSRPGWEKAGSVILKGGFASLVGAINAVLAGVLAYVASDDVNCVALIGFAALAVFWGFAIFVECRK